MDEFSELNLLLFRFYNLLSWWTGGIKIEIKDTKEEEE